VLKRKQCREVLKLMESSLQAIQTVQASDF
jgi:hypothetical protein